MEKKENKVYKYGLVGRDISYSFSKGYFTKKFETLNLSQHSYENFDLQDIKMFSEVIDSNKSIQGLNVTIPYKELIIPFLAELNEVAKQIGAVNTIKFTNKGLVGFNTDAYGFEQAIQPHLRKHHTKALILGTGGASKAVAYVFDTKGIAYQYVSRNPSKGRLTYRDLTEDILQKYTLLVNCTPLGTYPNIALKPDIPYQYITPKHLLFDLIYNPSKTEFLLQGESKGASICNGAAMLEFQAEKSWEIWNN